MNFASRFQWVAAFAALLSLFSLSIPVSAQNVADNIRPVGLVCLAGQACVGTAASTATFSGIAAVEESADIVQASTNTSAVEVNSGFDAEGAYQISDGFNAEQKYMASCFACHSTGAAGAPKVGAGMMSEWEPRLEKGLDAVVTNAINGVNAMPAKGLCFDCNEDDIRALVEYMLETSE